MFRHSLLISCPFLTACWPFGTGAAVAVELPSRAQAEASDQKTDALPSFKDIGASLNKQFGQTDPKDVGKAIDQNTPGEKVKVN